MVMVFTAFMRHWFLSIGGPKTLKLVVKHWSIGLGAVAFARGELMLFRVRELVEGIEAAELKAARQRSIGDMKIFMLVLLSFYENPLFGFDSR